MKKYHVVSGDGKGYYVVNYESYREAKELLKISQRHDPQAHIVEEEYHFTNADRIRAMNDEELAKYLDNVSIRCPLPSITEDCSMPGGCKMCVLKWLQQPAEDLE